MNPPSPEQNGVRPPPLKIQKDSNLIKKHTSTATSHRQPVIIYTHSPKVIHAQTSDFMALVQKLTGYTPPPGDNVSNSPPLPAKHDVAPGPTRKRKAPPAAMKEDPVQPSDDALRSLPPYPPSVMPAATTNFGMGIGIELGLGLGFEFDHLPADISSYMPAFSPDMLYRYNEMQPGSSSSMSNMESSSSTFSDL